MIELMMQPTLEENYSKSPLGRKLKKAILICLDQSHALFTPWGLNNAQLLRDSEPIKLFERSRQARECLLIINVLI